MDRHAPPPERCVGLRPSGQRHGTSRRTGRAVPVSTRRCSGRPCLRFSGNRTVPLDYTRFSVLLSNRGDRARMPRCSAPCSPRKPTSDRLRAHPGARRDPCSPLSSADRAKRLPGAQSGGRQGGAARGRATHPSTRQQACCSPTSCLAQCGGLRGPRPLVDRHHRRRLRPRRAERLTPGGRHSRPVRTKWWTTRPSKRAGAGRDLSGHGPGTALSYCRADRI